MFDITGKYNTAHISSSSIESSAYSQILNLLNQKFCEGSKVSIMPDVHAGAGCTIGTTMTIEDKVVPNLVGVDIGCGMLVAQLFPDTEIDLEKLDAVCHEKIPSGTSIRTVAHPDAKKIHIDGIRATIDSCRARLSVGTLGGGNHFIELDIDEDGNKYIVIHTGSRHLGVEVAKYWQDVAICKNSVTEEQKRKLIASLKDQGRQKDIPDALKELQSNRVPDDLAYLEGEDTEGYLSDMKLCQEYASINRGAILHTIFEGLGITPENVRTVFQTIHNYIDVDARILRKGAISLKKGEVAIIPMNMRDGSLIVVGKGNPEWNYSGPHGAGRVLSRSEAKRKLDVNEFRSTMEGIYTTCVSTDTIDESPMAYKPMQEIVKNIEETADVKWVIKPLYNFKAS